MPTVSCGFGTRAKLIPSRSKIEIVQSWLGRCFSMMAWKISIGGLKEMTLTTSPSRNTGTSTVTISRFFTAPMNRLEYCGLLVAKTFSTMSRLLRGGRLAVSSVTDENN